MSGAPNFNPGGMLHAPAPSASPLLFVQLETRYSIYDSSESEGQFIVEASVSHTHGEPFSNKTAVPGSNEALPFETLDFDVRIEKNDHLLVSSSINISTGAHLFGFDLGGLKPRLRPYHIVLYGAPMHETGYQNYTATTELYYLPAKNSGSTVKIDNLYGGMVVANNVTDYAFEPLLPFGFYTSCSGYLNYSLANVSAYKDLGFNAINPVCAFTDGDLGYLFDWLDETNVWYQYDMRGSYLNLSSVAEQIPLIKDRSSFLSWYTADEPDGWQYALNSTRLAYDLLKEQDPYHPTGLVLNCDNYYFKQYSSGADYVMEDAYPVGINATYSQKWGECSRLEASSMLNLDTDVCVQIRPAMRRMVTVDATTALESYRMSAIASMFSSNIRVGLENGRSRSGRSCRPFLESSTGAEIQRPKKPGR